jgi:hypothetical protein
MSTAFLEDKENIPNRSSNLSTPSVIPFAATMPSKRDAIQVEVEHKVTCECCYDDCNFDDMVSCSEGTHLFCGNCVSEYAKEQLFGNNRSDFRCMGSATCEGIYSDAMMKKALSPRLLENVEKHAYRENLLKFKIDSLWYVIETVLQELHRFELRGLSNSFPLHQDLP